MTNLQLPEFFVGTDDSLTCSKIILASRAGMCLPIALLFLHRPKYYQPGIIDSFYVPEIILFVNSVLLVLTIGGRPHLLLLFP